MMRSAWRGAVAGCLTGFGAFSASLGAVEPAYEIRRASGEIAIDGHLEDPGWAGALAVEEWFETRPGDNVAPEVDNLAYLAYDDRYLYAGFLFSDPEPEQIRAPLADRDNVPSYTDYGGVIVDTNNDGKTAQMFLANARGIQYDALSSDVSGEDSSPDFYWDAVGRITEAGWVLEMRIPFSSLRYSSGAGPQRWAVMLYRNRPRDYRYQMFSNRLPREASCFICNARSLEGLEDLPSGSHWVAAPYATGIRRDEPRGELGSELVEGSVDTEIGLDAKWIPNPDTVIDLTLNPDFSQIESDAAQVSANERFALFFPEKRPFFLEGADLFDTDIDALYTRTFTSPRWGARATGQWGKSSYTALVGEDRGGGSVILPGPQGSSLADQDFESLVAVSRWRLDLGERSFVSFLYSGREIDGGAFNRVAGPDFQWRPNDSDTVTGQVLFSSSQTPDRPDLADEWDGRDLAGHAASLWWNHDTRHVDWFVEYSGASNHFRADNGFVPRVGYDEIEAQTGYTFWPEESSIRRLRVSVFGERAEDREGHLLEQSVSAAMGLDGPWSTFFRVQTDFERVASGPVVLDRNRFRLWLDVRPGRRLARVFLFASLGDQIDFAHDRRGSGADLDLTVELRPTDHLDVRLDGARRWIDVDPPGSPGGRLFTADVVRARATYSLNARAYVRLIGQWVDTERDPRLYVDEVEPRSRFFSGSALFAYKLNWQTVLFVGYGDEREHAVDGRLEPAARSFFLKLSYAFQR